MRLLTFVKNKFYQTPVATWWHRIAPSVVVPKKFFGQTVFMDFRDNIDEISCSTRELERREEGLMEIPRHLGGLLWDVGANIGLFSVRAAVKAQPCVAFEFSRRAASLLRQTVDRNHLPITVVNHAFSTCTKAYTPAETADTENQVVFSDAGSEVSIAYNDAETLYGTPAFIKMDIEGGELEFFNCAEFKAWICEKQICWLVELHPAVTGFIPHWEDVPRYEIDAMHHLYCIDSNKLSVLREKVEAGENEDKACFHRDR